MRCKLRQGRPCWDELRRIDRTASAWECTWSLLMPPIDAALTQQVFAMKQTMSFEMNSLTCSSPARLLNARMPLSTPLAASMAGEVIGTGRAEEAILSVVLLPSLPVLLGAPGNLPSRLPIFAAFSTCSSIPASAVAHPEASLCCCWCIREQQQQAAADSLPAQQLQQPKRPGRQLLASEPTLLLLTRFWRQFRSDDTNCTRACTPSRHPPRATVNWLLVLGLTAGREISGGETLSGGASAPAQGCQGSSTRKNLSKVSPACLPACARNRLLHRHEVSVDKPVSVDTEAMEEDLLKEL